MIQRKHLEWTKNLTMYEVNLRQFTQSGTIKEFEQHLDKIKALGVGILWFMPIQPIGKKNRKGTLGSYYSISDYTDVNPDFGTLDEFKALVKRIHEMGMYVLLDWVANHTAWDHHWAEEFPEFYTKDHLGNFTAPFPEWADVMDLDFSNQDLRMAMTESMKFWIREVNIDGFRCDMAHLVPTDFWVSVRKELDSVKPVFMLAESENRELVQEAFDIEYNWNIFHLINKIAHTEKNVKDLDNSLQYEIFDFPRHAYQLFFTSNHDENSWNGSAIERLGCALEPMNVLVFTIFGMPLIYCGQEAGQIKRLSFFDKDLIAWKSDKMYPFYQTLTGLKLRNEALWCGEYGGEFLRIHCENDHAIFSFMRRKNTKKVFVILNLSWYDQTFTLFGSEYAGEYTDVFNGEKVSIPENTRMTLPSWNYKVYEY